MEGHPRQRGRVPGRRPDHRVAPDGRGRFWLGRFRLGRFRLGRRGRGARWREPGAAAGHRAAVLCVPAAPLPTVTRAPGAARRRCRTRTPRAHSFRAALLVTALTSQPGPAPGRDRGLPAPGLPGGRDARHRALDRRAPGGRGPGRGLRRGAVCPGPHSRRRDGRRGRHCPDGADAAEWRVLPLGVDLAGATARAC